MIDMRENTPIEEFHQNWQIDLDVCGRHCTIDDSVEFRSNPVRSSSMNKLRQTMIMRLHGVLEMRQRAYRTCDMATCLEISLKNGATLAYLVDTSHHTDTLFEIYDRKRISTKFRIRFEVACESLEKSYSRFFEHVHKLAESYVSWHKLPQPSMESRHGQPI